MDGPAEPRSATGLEPPVQICLLVRATLLTDAVHAALGRSRDVVVTDSLTLERCDREVKRLLSVPFDVLLVDGSGRESVVQLIRRIRDLLNEAKIVLFGVGPEEENVLRSIEAGAAGYVSIEGSCADLVHTILAVRNGKTPCSPRLAALVGARIHELAHQLHKQPAWQLPALTERERETLRLLAQGLSNKEIAKLMRIGTATVKAHLRHLFAKLGVSTRREAVQAACQTKVLSDGCRWLRSNGRDLLGVERSGDSP